METKRIQRRVSTVDPATRVPGFESPLGVMLIKWYLYSQASFVYNICLSGHSLAFDWPVPGSS